MFLEIAPNFFINPLQVVQFKLLYAPERGGYVWVFTLIGGKVLFSIPFKTEEKAREWLAENFHEARFMVDHLRENHKGYKAE